MPDVCRILTTRPLAFVYLRTASFRLATRELNVYLQRVLRILGWMQTKNHAVDIKLWTIFDS